MSSLLLRGPDQDMLMVAPSRDNTQMLSKRLWLRSIWWNNWKRS